MLTIRLRRDKVATVVELAPAFARKSMALFKLILSRPAFVAV